VKRFLPAALILLTTLSACAAGGVRVSPYADILGTWSGPAYAEGDAMGVDVTLVIQEVEGVLRGSISVPEQMMQGVVVQGLTWQNGILSGWISMQGMRVDVRLNKDGDVLRGSFFMDDFSGVMTLNRRGN
jgi:hypothetical protein